MVNITNPDYMYLREAFMRTKDMLTVESFYQNGVIEAKSKNRNRLGIFYDLTNNSVTDFDPEFEWSQATQGLKKDKPELSNLISTYHNPKHDELIRPITKIDSLKKLQLFYLPFYDPKTSVLSNLKDTEKETDSSILPIIICYRDRQFQLRIFLTNMLPILLQQNIRFKIYLIEQSSEKLFNRAKLFNVGYTYAKSDISKNFNFYADCYTFHDVDLLLIDKDYPYKCNTKYNQPRHLSVKLQSDNFILKYPKIFGGAVQIPETIFEKVNGFSNRFYGWGGEDDEMYQRLFIFNDFNLIREPIEHAKYMMINHSHEKSNFKNPDRFSALRKSSKLWKSDGLADLDFEIVEAVQFGLFEKITVRI